MQLDTGMTVEQRFDAFQEQILKVLRASGNTILDRSQVTLREFAPFAPDLKIVEMVSDREWILRLCGTNHCDRAKCDRTGVNVLENKNAAECAERKTIKDAMFAYSCGAKITWREQFLASKSALTIGMSYPAFGKNGERMIIVYQLLEEGSSSVEHDDPTRLSSVDLISSEFIDLGHGVPGD